MVDKRWNEENSKKYAESIKIQHNMHLLFKPTTQQKTYFRMEINYLNSRLIIVFYIFYQLTVQTRIIGC